MSKQEHKIQESSKYRYPGTEPFSTEQHQIFFGRKKDIQNLYDLLLLENLVILHSQSGLGKSSLINAGLLPKIKAQNDLIPFTIRFGGYNKEKQIIKPIDIFLQQIAINSKNKTESYLDKIIPNDNSIWYHLKKKQPKLEGQQKGFLLVFDQFEELFTYPEKDVLKFASAIKEILSDQIPQRFGKALKEKTMNELGLSDEEKNNFYEKLNIKILFAIRSDRMSLLSSLKDYLPNILRHCQELLPLNIEQAENALLQPAYKTEEDFMCPPFDYDDDFLDEILHFLTKNYSKTLNNSSQVDSFGLQVLCQNIEKKIIKKKIQKVSKTDIGDIESIYNNHYIDLIQDIGSKEEQIKVRKLIEEGLIFEKDKIRLRLYEQVILSNYDISKELLKRLLDTHLLRADEDSQQGGRTYELSHDSFINPILKAKKERIKQEKIQQFKKEQKQNAKIEQEKFKKELELEAKKELLQEARKKRNWAAAFGIITGVLVIVLFSITMALLKNNKTLKKTLKALEETKEKNIIKTNIISSKTDSLHEILELNKGLSYASLGIRSSRQIKTRANLEDAYLDFEEAKNKFKKADSVFNRYKNDSLSKEYLIELSKGYGSLSYNLLFIKKYVESEEFAYKGLEIDGSPSWIKTNLAHALLLQGKCNKAEKLYIEIKNMSYHDPIINTLGKACLYDIKKLEQEDLIPRKRKANVKKIKKILMSHSD